MSSSICLDSSVIIKLLTWEEGSDVAAQLMEKIVEDGLTVIMPSFAWAEVGSVLRQKVRGKQITPEEAEEAWNMFCRLKVIIFINNDEIQEKAWQISKQENLATLYDAAFLAVAEVVAQDAREGVCEFWTADEKLVHALGGRKKYVRLLQDKR